MDGEDDPESSARAVRECKRPWWVVQPIIRPLPKEAIAKGAITLKKAKPAEAEAPASEASASPKVASESKGAAQNDEDVATLLERTTSYQQSELVSG